jgi:hypothetical protein
MANELPASRPPSSLQSSEHVRNIAVDIILTLVTCGLFNLYVQYRQMVAVNAILKEEKYSFVLWLVLTLVTCGLYHIYHEYRKTTDLVKHVPGLSSSEPLISVVLTVLGLFIVADAIQQTHINDYFGSREL